MSYLFIFVQALAMSYGLMERAKLDERAEKEETRRIKKLKKVISQSC